jgi:MoaA/NifB/PqqE/SkfB family radical SAM enzyme
MPSFANLPKIACSRVATYLQSLSGNPRLFAVETCVRCNLHCPECALGGNLITREKGAMTFAQFKIIADKIQPFASYLYLMLWGEPLLNKDIITIISYASRFAKTCLSTNALLITPPIAKDLVGSGLTDLIVSIDGTTQEVYAKYRAGGNLEKAMAALRLLNDNNRRQGMKVRIQPQFVVFQHNQHQMGEFAAICRSLGLTPEFKAPYLQRNSQLVDSSLERYVRKKHAGLVELRRAMRQCQDAKNVCTILLDGSVVACCYDYNGVTTFGNIFEKGMMDIWNNPAYAAFRKSVRGGNPPPFCLDHCLMYGLAAPLQVPKDEPHPP